MEHKTDIIVLTWNKCEVTKAFFKSFFEKTKTPAHLIVIDNGSTDETVSFLESLEPENGHTLTKIFNSENKGYIEGVNQGIALSKAPYVCLANNDLEFTEGWLGTVENLLDSEKDIGLLNPNSNNLGVKPTENQTIEELKRDLQPRDAFKEMPFCIGFCMFIRRELIDRVGGLSTDYLPMYFDDTDYSMQAKQQGFRIGMAKQAYIFHAEHGSSDEKDPLYEEYFQRNKKKFEQKWGKTLRVGWVSNQETIDEKTILRAIDLAREGNFVFLFTKEKNASESVFDRFSLTEHTGIQFVWYKNAFDLFWKVIKKKKKYDIIIDSKGLLKWPAQLRQSSAMKELDSDLIREIKYKTQKEMTS